VANVTAFVLDDTISAGDDGATIPGVPGIWLRDRPVLASALGYTVAELRATIEELNLPLAEVKVPEGQANEDFPVDPNRLASAPVGPGGGTLPPGGDQPDPTAADPIILDHSLDLKDEIEERQQEDTVA
jgi:hypothetical protein